MWKRLRVTLPNHVAFAPHPRFEFHQKAAFGLTVYVHMGDNALERADHDRAAVIWPQHGEISMKKLLLATTALVAAVTAPAFAQAPAQPFSSTNFAVTVGGYARQFVSYSDNTNLAGQLRSSGVDQTSDNRLILTFRAALPSGMSAGSVWQLNPNANTATGNSITRRMWNFIEGSFGQVQLGGIENVASQSAVGGFEAFTGGMVYGDNNAGAFATGRAGVTAQSQQASNPSTGMDIDSISNKIVYYTPRIEGFQLGVNYTPEMAYRQGIATITTEYHNGYAANVNFVRTISGVGVRAAAGYITFEKPSGFNNSAAINNSTKDPNAWNVGLGFQVAGFDFGGSYQKTNNWRNIAVATTTAANAALADGFRNFNGHAWEVGAGYVFGAAAVSINYSTSRNDHSTVTNGVVTQQANGKDKIDTYSASGRYTLAPGVNVNLGVFTAKYTEGDGVNANFFNTTKNSSTANGVISGLTLAF
jgi:outer membrane protein OmpU